MTTFEKAVAAIESVGGDDALDQMNPAYEQNKRAIVCAILRAIREPDEAMLEAGTKTDVRDPDGWNTSQYELEVIWPAMIDAILEEGKST